MTKLYHFGLHLKVGDVLIPDYHKKSRLVLPYVQALNKGQDVFENMLIQGRYLKEVLRRSGVREWSDYCKWATEGLFEYIRQCKFPDRYSRIKTNYFFDTVEKCRNLYKADYIDVGDCAGEELFELEVQDDSPQYLDMNVYDEAYNAIENEEHIETLMAIAEKYWNFETTPIPNFEILSDKKAVIINKLNWEFD